jgi:CDP-diacylglycerol--glycerol-3-phosphate 3-phosphatidyltransferase
MDKKAKGMSFANKVSIFRIISVPFFVAAILYYQPQRDYLRFAALAVFTLAVFSDFLDGFLARVMQQRTKAGTVLDPLADKVLLSCAFIFVYLKDNFPLNINVPLWLVIIVLSRDLLILFGSAVIYVTKNELILTPSRWGKYTTFFQMFTIVSVLLQFKATQYIIFFAAFFTLCSAIDYLKKGLKVLYGPDIRHTA